MRCANCGTDAPRSRWPASATTTVVGLSMLIVGLVGGCAVAHDGDGGGTDQIRPLTADVTTTVAPEETTTSTEPTTTTAPHPTSDLPLDLPDVAAAALVDRLVVADPDPSTPTYVRDLFDGGRWAYDPTTGCNTRERVLIDESLVKPTVDDRCRSTGGHWRSAYDGLEITDPSDLQIDHFVPLADAWRSGAWRWIPEQRLAYANDLTSPDTLLAVSASSNQSKGDSTPDEWLPPSRADWCDYASTWVRVKARWALEVTPAEKATLVSILSGC